MENKDNEDEIGVKLEKQNLIREEIINKGYDSIQFIEYLIQCKGPGGENINIWTVSDLKNAIKDYIYLANMKKEKINENNNDNGNNNNNYQDKPNESNQNNNESNINNIDLSAPSAPKEKKLGESFLMSVIDIKNNIFSDSSKQIEKIDYGLHTPNILDCRPIDNTDLGKQEEIYIKIGFPEKIDGGFFGRDSVSFTVTAIPLGFVVKRNYLDFEWLRDILIKLYDSNFVPSLPSLYLYNKDNEDAFFKECIRYLEKVMNYLLSDPIIKSSQILYDFLCIEDPQKFEKYKKEIENTTPNNDIQNYQSINGKLDININENGEKKFETIKNFCYENERLYKQLNNNLNDIGDYFSNIIKKLNDSSSIFEKLYNLTNKYYDKDFLQKETFAEMKKMFSCFQNTFKMEREKLKVDINENFNFLSKNYFNFYQLIKKVEESKRIYKKEEKDLVSLKNDLFNKSQKGSPVEDNMDLSKLLPKNTEATLEMKKKYGFYLNRTLSEFDRMRGLDNDLFKTEIIKGIKSQINIVNKLGEDVKNIIEAINQIEMEKKNNEIKNEIKDIKDDQKGKKFENEINDKKE